MTAGMSVDLRFKQALGDARPVNLIFGDDEGIAGSGLSFAITLTAPAAVWHADDVPPTFELAFSIALESPQVSFAASYDVDNDIGPQGAAAMLWQDGADASVDAAPIWSRAAARQVTGAPSWMPAWRRDAHAVSPWARGSRLQCMGHVAHQNACSLRLDGGVVGWEESMAVKQAASAHWQETVGMHVMPWHSMWRRLVPAITNLDGLWQDAVRLTQSFESTFGPGVLMIVTRGMPWQPGAQALPGRSQRLVVEPSRPLCYVPPLGLQAHLSFDTLLGPSLDLLFGCKRTPEPASTVVIPIRKVYMVLNTTVLRRADDNTLIPALSMNMAIDFESWTWGFTASVPASAQELVMAHSGEPVALIATINGTAYRLLAESVSRERSFGKASIRVQGRGHAALLDAPYAAVRSFAASSARTAQQLMVDALSDNGVAIGWELDFGLTDWLVPGGVWSHQGTHISAVNAIAAAAGGYVQPHAFDAALRVLPKYPVAPWHWDEVTPDVEIPSAVATREGIAWTKRPGYHRVFVSGQQQGLLGQVTRSGTAGSLVAPMVTDALMTHADAIRQRGTAVLGDTGSQATVSVRLPVLTETGVIEPGKWVRYVDGADSFFGIVRSTSIDVANADVWQTVGIETRGVALHA